VLSSTAPSTTGDEVNGSMLQHPDEDTCAKATEDGDTLANGAQWSPATHSE